MRSGRNGHGNNGHAASSMGLVAALYARKSTEQNGVSEEDKSVRRQLDNARLFAEKHGWAVGPEFSDDGISGALDETRRPGLLACLQAAQRGEYQVLVVARDDRLSRDQWNAGPLLKKLHAAGISLWYYQQSRQVDLSGAVGKFMEAVRAFGSEFYRESVRDHMVDALKKRAAAGQIVGGRMFGYISCRDKDGHPNRTIHKAQAAIVRKVYQAYANGRAPARIAADLNDQHIPGPGWRHRHWTKSSVRYLLARELYHGVNITDWGDEQIRVERPDLKIINDPLWAAVQARLHEQTQSYLRRSGGRLWGKPSNSTESKYLLVGFLRCSSCGAGLAHVTRGTAKHRYHYYQCVAALHAPRRPDHSCTNQLLSRMEDTNEAVLRSIEEQILRPDLLTQVLQRAIQKLGNKQDRDEQRTHLDRQRQAVDKELANLGRAIARGDAPETLLEQMRGAERHKKALTQERQTLEGAAQLSSINKQETEAKLKRIIAEQWMGPTGLRGRSVSQLRQLLRKLLPTKLVMTADAATRRYSFAGETRISAILGEVMSLGRVGSWRTRGAEGAQPTGKQRSPISR